MAASSARLAAARADDREVERLRDLAEGFAAATDPQGRRRCDSRFHIGLAIAAQSRRLTALSVQVQSELAPLLWTIPRRQPDHQAMITAHCALVDAIAVGDPTSARHTALSHSEHETEHLIDSHLELVLATRSS